MDLLNGRTQASGGRRASMPGGSAIRASAMALGVMLSAAALPAAAQDLGNLLKRTVQRAVESEVLREADRETREATHCALGNEACTRSGGGGSAQAVSAAGTEVGSGAGDRPLLAPYEGATVVRREADEFTDYPLRIGKVRASSTQAVEGRLTRLTYEGPKGRSVLEVFRNYEAELQRAGFTPLYRCARAECGDIRKDIESGERYLLLWGAGDHRYLAARRSRPQGDAYAAVYVTRNNSGGPARERAMIQLDVVETRAIESRMAVVDADAMQSGLARDGRVALYGLQFEFGRDTLQPDAARQLAELARLLEREPGLSVSVVGHTDNRGGHNYNLDLSRRRAERVVDTLANEHGIAAGRMHAEGFGAAAPVANNDDETGRALNRRVEIVKR